MAINSFDDVIEAIKDDAAKQALLKEAESNPEIKGGWLRQADYSRKMNEAKARLDYAAEWDKWKADNWDDKLGMLKTEVKNIETIRELEFENLTLKGKLETEMTYEQLQDEVNKLWDNKSKGVLTEDSFAQKFGKDYIPKGEYEKDVNTRLGNMLANVEQLYGKTSMLAMKHMKEFDEIIDPLSIVDFAYKNGVSDLDKAYGLMVSPRRDERQAEVRKKELEDAEKRGEMKARQEVSMGPNGRIPTDSGSPQMGHLQQRLLKVKVEGEPAVPDDVKMDGSGSLGHSVAQLYRQEQMNKGNV